MSKKDFGERLAWLRICIRNCSARDMSLSIGQNAGYISSIENGRCMPSMRIFYNICEYLEITPAEFFDDRLVDPLLYRRINKCLIYMNLIELESLARFLEERVKDER